jgi:hypothetical protein
MDIHMTIKSDNKYSKTNRNALNFLSVGIIILAVVPDIYIIYENTDLMVGLVNLFLAIISSVGIGMGILFIYQIIVELTMKISSLEE